MRWLINIADVDHVVSVRQHHDFIDMPGLTLVAY